MSKSMAPESQSPNLGERKLSTGMLIGGAAFLMFVVVPVSALWYAGTLGFVVGISGAVLVAWGAVLTVLAFAVWFVKPTEIYGPLKALSSAMRIAFVVFLSVFAAATYTQSTSGRFVTASLNFGNIALLFVIVPVLGVMSGVFFTLQDHWQPGVRVAMEDPTE